MLHLGVRLLGLTHGSLPVKLRANFLVEQFLPASAVFLRLLRRRERGLESLFLGPQFLFGHLDEFCCGQHDLLLHVLERLHVLEVCVDDRPVGDQLALCGRELQFHLFAEFGVDHFDVKQSVPLLDHRSLSQEGIPIDDASRDGGVDVLMPLVSIEGDHLPPARRRLLPRHGHHGGDGGEQQHQQHASDSPRETEGARQPQRRKGSFGHDEISRG